MMNTGAVSQVPAAAAEPSRNAGGKGQDESEAGEFPGLLSMLAAKNKGTDSRTAETAGENGRAHRGQADGREVAEVPDGQECVADSEQDPVVESGETEGLTSIDLNALRHILNGTGIPGSATTLVAIAARIADGTASDAERALAQAAASTVQKDGEALTPEQLILARLDRSVGAPQSADDSKQPVIAASVTVTARETHFAPIQTVAGTAAATQWGATGWGAEQVAAANNAASDKMGADITAVADRRGRDGAGGVRGESNRSQLAMLHAAVTALDAAQPQPGSGQGDSREREVCQFATEGPVGGDDDPVGPDQAVPVARADVLVNAGQGDRGGVIRQIADRIATDAGAIATQAAGTEPAAFAVKHGSPVKVLHLQLQPEELGLVTIRMSVKDQTLRLDLEVGRGETAHVVQRDRDTLTALLRSAGYAIDGVQVRLADVTGNSTQPTNSGPSGMQMQSGGQSGSSQADARTPGERPRDGYQGNNFGNRRPSEDDPARRSHRSGGVYI